MTQTLSNIPLFLGATTRLRPDWQSILGDPKPDARLKDQVKIAENLAAKREAQQRRAAFMPITATIDQWLLCDVGGVNRASGHGARSLIDTLVQVISDVEVDYAETRVLLSDLLQYAETMRPWLYGFNVRDLLRIAAISCNDGSVTIPPWLWTRSNFLPQVAVDPYEALIKAEWQDHLTLPIVCQHYGLAVAADLLQNPEAQAKLAYDLAEASGLLTS